MTEDLSQLADDLVRAANGAGAEASDALVMRTTATSVDVLSGALEHVERTEQLDIGLRVILGQRQASVSLGDGRPETIAEAAARAVAMAREAPADASVGLADPGQLTHSTNVAALELADPSDPPRPDGLENIAREAEAAAAAVEGVSKVQSSSAGHSHTAYALAASNGFSAQYARTSHYLSAVAITGEGTSMERDHASESRVFASDLPGAASVGRTAGDRAGARAGARKPPTGPVPVLFDERVSGSLMTHLLMAINGSAVVRGGTWLRDALGESVLPDSVSLIEDPHRPRIAMSRLFDAEGLPTAKRSIVENGVLTGWTLDLATGRKLGMESTANASRGTAGPPGPMTGNLWLTPGPASRADLIRDMGRGLLVTSLIGSSVNPTTGDYSRGASGYWVEDGDIQYPVNECTIAGNLRDMLRTIVPANDGRPELSRVIPSLLVEGLTLAGA